MTEWDACRCRKGHATARGFARCKVRGLAWITGRGDWALVAWCGNPTITLWPTETEAADRGSVLAAARCGRACRGAHQIIHINLNREAYA
ncbi:hypothetical protein [Agrococcus beijingensis]|uniref:hypothetical protein n=1 Tax=Agrococcus beijingensis TaxID=3068634 RepID=UPI002741574B|nr:hypothetical protein [Agrococcus sp. REN33]